MVLWIKRTLILTIALVMLSGCLSLGENPWVAEPDALIDNYRLTDSVATSSTGCQYDYRVYEPVNPATATSVVIGHGFLRDQDNMVGLSRALANRGIRVATLDFCNMRFWNGAHQQNAKDMQDLARQISADDDVIYAGFSAGALAAVLAANEDSRAILTLDLVDQNDLGLDAITRLSTPLIGITGPPSSCNANNNGAALFNERSEPIVSALTQLPNASHCEFEAPSDWVCELVCSDENSFQTAQLLREGIIQAAVNSILPFLSEAQ